MGILLVTGILDDLRNFANLFSKGNPIILGGVGWCVILLCIIWAGYPCVQYIRKYLGLKHIKAVCTSKKENNKVKLNRAKLDKEKREKAYEKQKRRLEKDLKQKKELKKNLDKDFTFPFLKGRKVMKEIQDLERDIEDLERMVSTLEEQMEEEIEKLINICERKQKKVEKYEKQIEEAERELEENKKDFMEKMKKKIAAFVTIFLILLADSNNMLVTAKELINTMAGPFDSSKEMQMNEPETEEPMSEDVSLGRKEENSEASSNIESVLREHSNYNFILDDAQLHKVIDGDIEDIIFLTDYSKNMIGYDQFLTDCREGNIIEILPKVNDDSMSSLDELLNEIAEDLEKPFLEKIDMGKMIQTQTEWERSAPRSAELENIMDKRRQVLAMEESISVRRTVYFLLANDYQRLGNECLIQGKDSAQIYYYYGMSIYCCYCALGYERSGENSHSDEEIMNYVKARYKDIIDNAKMGIPAEKVYDAEKIYSLLNE